MDPTALRQRLKTSLREAILARNSLAAAALRSAVGAVENAEAVEGPAGPYAPDGKIAKATLGVGAAEVRRRELSVQEVIEVIRTEVDDRRRAAAEYERVGRPERASRLRAEADVLLPFLDDASR
jgi:uncharacterized protein